MVYSMSGFIESSIILQNIIMFIMEICLILELILLIFRIMSLVKKKKILVSAAELFFSFLFMTGLLNDHRCSMGDKRYKPLFRLFPADIMLVLVILLTVYLIRALYRELKEYRNALSPWSVHEAVNNVPCGVCISDPLGRIILCNIKMQELSRVLIGNYLQNYHTLHSVLNADSVKKPVRKLSSDSNVFYFPDGSVWLFQEYQLKEASFTGVLGEEFRKQLGDLDTPISMLSYVGICDVNLFGAEFEFKYMRTYRCAVMQELDRIKQLVSCLADGDPIRIKFAPGEDNSAFDTLHIPEKIELDA